MLQIITPESEVYDESTNRFYTVKSQVLRLEHSLVSISKWESKWKKPFLHTEQKTDEELKSYVKYMTLTQNVNDLVYEVLSTENYDNISNYIKDPMTATWFAESNGTLNRRIITSEIIYYWMFANNIPMECQKWHLNRLITLIRVCVEESKPPKKIGKSSLAQRNRALNEARKARLKTRG